MQTNFAKAEAAIVRSDISPHALKLLLHIRLDACYPKWHAGNMRQPVELSHDEVASICQVRKSRVPHIVTELVNDGLISFEKGRGRAKSCFWPILSADLPETHETVSHPPRQAATRRPAESGTANLASSSQPDTASFIPGTAISNNWLTGTTEREPGTATGTTEESKEYREKQEAGSTAPARDDNLLVLSTQPTDQPTPIPTDPPTPETRSDIPLSQLSTLAYLFAPNQLPLAERTLRDLRRQHPPAVVDATLAELTRRRERGQHFGPALLPLVAADQSRHHPPPSASAAPSPTGKHAHRYAPSTFAAAPTRADPPPSPAPNLSAPDPKGKYAHLYAPTARASPGT